jgi:hypothetical protein
MRRRNEGTIFMGIACHKVARIQIRLLRMAGVKCTKLRGCPRKET